MAAGTGADHLDMIHGTGRHRFPYGKLCGGMTCPTDIGRVDVSRILARGNGSIMASTAFPIDLQVIHGAGNNRYPGRKLRLGVAGLANIAAIDMVGTLARCGCTVMTTAAGADHLIVIDAIRGHRFPGINAMTGFTQITGINVGGSLASGSSTIMTGNTGFTGQTMVE